MKPMRLTLVPAACLLLGACSSQPPPPASASAHRPAEQKPYVLPAEFSLKPIAERGPQGEVFISGTTNFPDGMKMWVVAEHGKVQPDWIAFQNPTNAIVNGGHFRAGPFYNDESVPITGHLLVVFDAMFNGAWQSQGILAAFGEGGKNAHGKLFKLTDPEVADSGKELRARFNLSLPPPTPEAYAICDVKHATLSIPGFGRPDRDVEKVIAWFLQSQTGVKPAKGWTASPAGGKLYNVTYDFINGGAGEEQALWTADISTGRVKYVNKAAKVFSGTPGTVF